MFARHLVVSCLLVAIAATVFSSQLEVDAAASKIEFTAKATGHSFTGTVTKWTLALSVPEGADQWSFTA